MATASAYPISLCTSFAEGGYTSLHQQLERSVASFIGKEDAVVFNMGWATNFLGIPSLMGPGCLIISDSLNHNSIVAGARNSGAAVRVFKHDDLDGLEALVRNAIVQGQERTHRPWKKIFIMVEGIYSMEGQYVDLAGIVRIAKRYKCYTYLDEAHSIGAMGATGRGVCEHCGVNPADVDVLMGTFTKSFGAMGGYIAGSRDFIAHVRAHTLGFSVDNAMSPVVCQQIMTSFAVIKGEDGTTIGKTKLEALKFNANYMRQKLMDMQLEVLGDWDSPVIPILLYNPTKIAAFSRECFKRGVSANHPTAAAAACSPLATYSTALTRRLLSPSICSLQLAVVVVGFPATPLVYSRARMCISAGHTQDELDRALEIISEVADVLRLRYKGRICG